MNETAGEPSWGVAPAGGLIEAVLGEQGDLTAVERFARFHDDGASSSVGAGAGVRVYSSLLPVRPPGPGQQYAFEVDLDRCSGCKACVAACHAMNGLDVGEVWREVGLIVGGEVQGQGLPVLQHVTTACHHCLDPACLNACPVDAYEKDPLTGIVHHLDDQCIGCQYCILACPYDAPKFNPAKGIVRKCDMCSGRLAAGEAPACVQGCPHQAIRIRVVDRDDVVAAAEAGVFLPSAPEPGYTLPTTRYVSDRPSRGPVRAADRHVNDPEHAHAPLVAMLVLTQGAAGAFVADALARSLGLETGPALPLLGLVLCGLGLAASVFHLGRPLYAYRALIGFRHSWLSREVAALGVFGALAVLDVALLFFRPARASGVGAAAAWSGLAAVGCSVMVYHVVRRPFWRASAGVPKFFGTSAVLGLAAALVVSGGDRAVAAGLAAATAVKLVAEAAVLRHLGDPRATPLRRSAERLLGPLAGASLLRLGLGLAGGLALPALAANLGPPAWRTAVASSAFLAVLAGELAERYLFFAAVVKPRMPGGVAT